MVNWKAVGIGFLVEVVVGVFAIGLPGIGHMAAGLFGGFVAGYLAGGSLLRGLWHGLLAGALGGLIIAVILGLTITLLGGIGLGPLGSFIGVSVFFVIVVIAFLLALDSAIGGIIGAFFSNN